MSTRKAHGGKKIFFIVTGILVIIIGIIPIAYGAAILIFNRSADADGYHWSSMYEVRTSTYAFTIEMPSLSTVSLYSRIGTNLFGADNAIQAKWMVEPVDTSRDLFTGCTTVPDGKNYIATMETEGAIWSMGGPFDPEINVTSSVISGEGLAGPEKSPFSEDIWLQSCLGTGTADIDFQPVWNTNADDQYLIIMNDDGTKNVQADIQIGYYFPVFSWLPWRLIPLGVLICLGGAYLAVKGIKLKV